MMFSELNFSNNFVPLQTTELNLATRSSDNLRKAKISISMHNPENTIINFEIEFTAAWCFQKWFF